MLIPIDRPIIDARNFKEAKVYTDPADLFTIDHENKAVVRIVHTQQLYRYTNATTAIEDGIKVGQELRILYSSTSPTWSAFVLRDNANTDLNGDWVSYLNPADTKPLWIDLVWDGSNWVGTNRNDGRAASISGLNAHAEGSNTTASGAYSHAEGLNTTASGADGAHAEGSGCVAATDGSHAGGRYSRSFRSYEHVRASYFFNALGDAQEGSVVAMALINFDDTDAHTLYIKNVNTEHLVIQNDSLMAFEALVVAKNQATNVCNAYKITGAIENSDGACSILSTTITNIHRDDADITAAAVANDTEDSLEIQLTDASGDAGDMRCVASIKYAEVAWVD